MPPGPSTSSPSSIVQPRSDEVRRHEGAVVVVARDAVAVEVLERLVDRVQAEGLPRLPDRGVVAGVEDGGRPAAVGDRPGDRVHADVVVPVGDERDDGVALLGHSQVEVGGLLGGGPVELQALVVGVDGALDEPTRLLGGHVAAELEVLRPRRARCTPPRKSSRDCQSRSASSVRSWLSHGSQTTSAPDHEQRR